MEVIDFLKTEGDRYRTKHMEKVRQFGVVPLEGSFDPECADHDLLHNELLRAGVWGVRGKLDLVAKPPTVVIGGMRVGGLHLGHLSMAIEMAAWIRFGARPVLVIQDAGMERGVEKREFHHKFPFVTLMEKITQGAANKDTILVLDQYADGFSALQEKIDSLSIIRKIRQLYGWGEDRTIGNLREASFMAASLLASNRFFPNQSAVFMADIQQATHIEFARHVSRKLSYELPTVTFRRLVQSLKGPNSRMSKSNPSSMLTLNSDDSEVAERLMSSFSGGRLLASEQARHGGDPHACSFFACCRVTLNLAELDTMLRRCRLGEVTCRACKEDNVGRCLSGIPA